MAADMRRKGHGLNQSASRGPQFEIALVALARAKPKTALAVGSKSSWLNLFEKTCLWLAVLARGRQTHPLALPLPPGGARASDNHGRGRERRPKILQVANG